MVMAVERPKEGSQMKRFAPAPYVAFCRVRMRLWRLMWRPYGYVKVRSIPVTMVGERMVIAHREIRRR